MSRNVAVGVWLVCLAVIGQARAADLPPAASQPLRTLAIDLAQSKDDNRAGVFDRIAESNSSALIPALKAFDMGVLRLQDGQPVIYAPRIDLKDQGKLYPIVDAISQEQLKGPDGKPLFAKSLGPIRRASAADRKRIQQLTARLALFNPDLEKRKDAIIDAGDRAELSVRDVLQKQDWGDLKYEADVALARIELAHGDRSSQLWAAKELASLAPLGSTDRIEESRKKAEREKDAELVAAIDSAITAIGRHQRYVNIVQETFAGLSLGSILVLMGLGLSIIFGLMRVINMAHGEFMMLGAFSAYVVCQIFKNHVPAEYFNYYWPLAIVASFLVPALVGWLCEVTIIRRLYGRPLDSLLATWGISLILIQAVRMMFGDTLAVTPPSWFGGGWEAVRGLVLPYNRLFIIGYCAACVALVNLVVYRTKFGLLLRATQQNRPMASALGVDTRKIDGLAFAFGTGLAGLAGCAVILFDKLNPQMGQGYIVDSFMVVIVGGVGKLSGVVVSGLGLGFLTKYLEPWLQAVYGKVAVLLLVILFIQRWPSGLFADKGRLADD